MEAAKDLFVKEAASMFIYVRSCSSMLIDECCLAWLLSTEQANNLPLSTSLTPYTLGELYLSSLHVFNRKQRETS